MDLFDRLALSSFRRQFKLNQKDSAYLASKGLPLVVDHAREFLRERLAPASPANDGAQTPMHGHPAFVAQHATGTCCRGCLQKWHKIPKGRELTEEEISALSAVIEEWLRRQNVEPRKSREDSQLSLF